MDVYGEKVCKELGLPTAIKDIKDLNAFQLLKLDPSIDDENLVREAAATQLRKLRPWQKEPYRDFANRMELAIVKSRKVLLDPARRAQVRQQVQGSPQMAAATRATSQMKHPGGAWSEEVKAPEAQASGMPKWLNLVIIAVIVIIVLIAIGRMGGISGIIESIKSAAVPK